MKTTKTLAALALAVALAACGAKDEADPYLAAIPELAALTLDTSAAAPAGAVMAAVDPTPVSSLQDDLAVVHRKAQAMNDALRGVFARLEEVASSGGQELPNGVKVYGPAVRCVQPDGAGGCVPLGQASLRLVVKRHTDAVASFIVQARGAASTNDAEFKPVLAGYLMRGMMARRGAGRLWVNHVNLKAVAAGFEGTGYLAAGFAAGPVAKAITYRMLDFTRDPALHEAVTAAFTGWRNGAGIVRARVAGLADLDKTGAAKELGFWRAVWAPALGGRAFTVVTNHDDNGPLPGGSIVGDVAPAGTLDRYWFARACYAPGQTAPSYKEWFSCDRATTPFQCVTFASGQGAVDPGVPTSFSSWQETTCYWNAGLRGEAEPQELRPPGLAPGDANDDREEDGAAHVGLMPESCPTTVDATNPDPTPPGMQGGGMGGMM